MSELIDNRAQRVQALKGIIQHLHSGKAPDEVRGELRDIVRQTDYSEIVAMEQELMAGGMPVEEIQCMCDLHSQVTRDVLVQLPPKAVPPGHPVDTFRRENEALGGVLASLRAIHGSLEALADEADAGELVLRWRQAANELADIDKHYQRKEHTFFPALERHGITAPPKVMWAKDDEVRALAKDLCAALRQQGVTAGEWKLVAASAGDALVRAVEEMIYKEEAILLPMCLDAFTEEDWAGIWSASPRYGWCLVAPREGYRPARPEADSIERGAGGGMLLPTGYLTLDQLVAIFSALPVDLTFVDAEDCVRFFSEGPDRIFARSKAILGRKVQNCHPPRSVETVERILDDFREGRQDVAEFWINFQGRFVHIRYFAVRQEGKYVGTLEVTQDLTPLRALEGERRLLQYESEPAGAGVL